MAETVITSAFGTHEWLASFPPRANTMYDKYLSYYFSILLSPLVSVRCRGDTVSRRVPLPDDRWKLWNPGE